MDKLLQDVLGAVVGSAILGGAGLLVTWGMVRQMVRDLKERQAEDRGRIDKLQSEAQQTPLLAQSIEHMGEKFAQAIQSLGDRMAEQSQHFHGQISDIKSQISEHRPRARRQSGAN